METVLLTILAVLIVSLVSLVGVLFLALKEQLMDRIIPVLVAFASGALLGGAFLHLLPEASEQAGNGYVFYAVLGGILLFFLLEKLLYWRHCHDGKCDVHAFTYLNLIGDGVHNFIDGLIIAAGFAASIPLGLSTTLAILLHEIPQEIGDFGVLIYGGFSKFKALAFNFASALLALLGAIFAIFLSSLVSQALPYLLAFAAGGFIYVAASDLIPEMHKTKRIDKSMGQFIFLAIGMLLMWFLGFVFG